MNHFDQTAKTWDNNPIVWERSSAIAEKMKQKIKLGKDRIALEFGAGTGVLSFMLKDNLSEIVLMDSSVEMVKVMQEKVNKANVSNLKPIFFDLISSEYSSTFDLIYSQMVLHHVDDIDAIMTKFHKMLEPGGEIAIADLYKEDGSFHDWKFNGHLGFDVDELCRLIEGVGFKHVNQEECYIIHKTNANNEEKQYPVFLITATK